MASSSSSSASSPEPPLPLSIETLLSRIYDEQFMSPLDSKSRHHLALLGEEAALKILQRFRSLPDYISFMVRVPDSGSRPSISQSHLYDSIMDSLSLEETTGDSSLCSSKSQRQINFNPLCLGNPSMLTGSLFDSNKNHGDTDSSSVEVPLPLSVEKALRRIGEEQLMPPLDSKTRSELAFIGEETALRLLQRFRSLSDYITFMVGISDPISSQGSVSCSGPQTSWSSLFESQQDIDFSGVLCWEEQKSTSFTRQINLNSSTFTKPIPSAPMLDYLTDHSQSYSCNSEDAVLDSLSMEERNRDTAWSFSCSPRNLTSASLEKRHILDSPILASLGELEFRKAFIILSYCGKKKLEDVATVGMIERIKNLPMKTFEAEAWRAVGCKCIDENERSKNVEWDSGKTYLYHCHVDPDATYTFKGPYLQKHRTHLQRVLGDENVLNVKFVEREMPGVRSSVRSNVSTSGFNKIADEGILVGFRRYHFFVFKDGGKAEKKKNPTSSPVKCFFVCMEAECFVQWKRPHTSFNMSVHEARCVFMHVHMVSSVAKYMARLSLILSKTVKLEIDLAMVNIERIADIPCLGPDGDIIYGEDGEPLIHTDGTGYISEDLAWRCPHNIFKVQDRIQGEFERVLDSVTHDGSSSVLPQSHIREPPLLIQCRLFINGTAVKGTFLVNKKLPPNTIQIRHSMIKVETDPKLLGIQSSNSLEIVSTSYRPRKTSILSRYLIALLNYGGVSTEFFMELVANSLEDASTAHFNKRVALKVSLNYGEIDDFVVPRMILCGIPLDEPYLRDRLSVIMREERKGLKDGKLPITECYYLMGTADPTGMLKDDEVCVILDHGQVSGKVLVYRHPGLHFGDIHLLTATCVKEIEEVVGNSKYAIFFPSKGPRSLASEIANGDFDGDMYWISRNPELLASYNPSEPWTRKYSTKSTRQRKPVDFSHKELEDVLFQQFLTSRFQPSYNIGSAADSWLAFMDRLLILNDDCVEEKHCLRRKMLHLVDVYYDALDAPKTGKKVEVPKELKAEKFPHYMGRPNFFRSKSVLGQIYDMVDSFQTTELLSEDIWKLPCFEEDVPRNCLDKWFELYQQYKREMTSVLKIDDRDAKDSAANDVVLKYKQILYGAPEFEETTRDKKDIFDEALAIYHIAYNYAKQINGAGRCGFPWKVAGRALCTLYAIKQDKDVIVCQKSVLREILN